MTERIDDSTMLFAARRSSSERVSWTSTETRSRRHFSTRVRLTVTLPDAPPSRLREAIDALAENPRAPGNVKLQGEGELYRVRVGDYRIVYQIQDAVLVVLVVQIGHRREIYRQ